MNVEFVEQASAELDAACKYYAARQPGLGRALRHEARQAIARIVRAPQAHAMISRRARRCHLRRFPYKIVFQVQSDIILILAVAHVRQRPGYWDERTFKD